MEIKFINEIKKAIEIRLVEERLLTLFSEGELNGTVHTAVGQEFIGVFISKYLNNGDFITSNHRGHGHYLARFGNIKGLLAEIMGKEDGISGGYGGSQHFVDTDYLSNGIQGGMLPIAAGVALNFKMKKTPNVAISYIGDGTLGEGIVYEVMNITSVYELPLLIVLENNGYAQSTSSKQTFRGDLKKRAEGFGLKYYSSSSFDLDDLDSKSEEAIDFVRQNRRPAIIEIDTYRLNAHSKGDDNRLKSEVESFRDKDVLTEILIQEDNEISDYVVQTKENIEEIISEIKLGPTLSKIKEPNKLASLSRLEAYGPEIEEHDRYNALICKALTGIFTEFKDSMMIGEDIQNKTEFTNSDYGGAFKVSKDMSDLFPGRVLNSPISEAAILGLMSGYSMKAGRSFVEIMFGDFTTLIFDQVLQHASKFETMFNGKVKCPVTIRTPMGGKRGYGPTHSQSIEKHFLGIDNFAIIVLHHRISPEYLYQALMTVSMPSMVIENKILYTIDTSKQRLPNYNYNFDNRLFPNITLSPKYESAEVTVVCYGEVLSVVEDAMLEMLIEEEIYCEVVCPTLISEIDIDPIFRSLRETKKLVIIEEGSGYAAWGSEVISMLHESGFSDFALKRFSNNSLIPSSFKAEIELLPNKSNIVKTIINFI